MVINNLSKIKGQAAHWGKKYLQFNSQRIGFSTIKRASKINKKRPSTQKKNRRYEQTIHKKEHANKSNIER